MQQEFKLILEKDENHVHYRPMTFDDQFELLRVDNLHRKNLKIRDKLRYFYVMLD